MTDLELFEAYMDYNPLTGELRWNAQREQLQEETNKAYKTWMTRYAGRPAGAISRARHHRYGLLRMHNRIWAAHRAVWSLIHNRDIPGGCNVLAIDGDYLNLKADNLRLEWVNNNRPAGNGGVRGVSWHSVREYWAVQVDGEGYGNFREHHDAVTCLHAVKRALGRDKILAG